MDTRESQSPHALPTAQTARLIDFEKAVVVTPMIMPPRPRLVVNGWKPTPTTRVELVPLAYIRQPEYWGIEVIGVGGLATINAAIAIPYSMELDLEGLTGTAGVEVIGAHGTQRIPLTADDTTQFVGAVEGGTFRPMFPSPVEDRLRLTTVSAKDDAGPETGEIDLSPYDGALLRVRGHHKDGWIYSATVDEQVRDSILSIVARQVLPHRA